MANNPRKEEPAEDKDEPPELSVPRPLTPEEVEARGRELMQATFAPPNPWVGAVPAPAVSARPTRGHPGRDAIVRIVSASAVVFAPNGFSLVSFEPGKLYRVSEHVATSMLWRKVAELVDPNQPQAAPVPDSPMPAPAQLAAETAQPTHLSPQFKAAKAALLANEDKRGWVMADLVRHINEGRAKPISRRTIEKAFQTIWPKK